MLGVFPVVQKLASNGIEKVTPPTRRAAFWPALPTRLADLRIPKSVIFDLILRHLHLDGMTSLEITSRTIKVSVPILDALFREMRQQHLVEVKGSVGEDYA